MTLGVRALDASWRGLVRLLPTGRADGEPYNGTRLAAYWLLTRALTLMVVVAVPAVTADLGYYVRALNGGMDGMPAGLREYPLPAVWLLSLPDLVAQGDVIVYPLILIATFVVVDALFTLFLHRSCPPATVTLWLAAGVLVGPLLYTRFDILTGTAVAVAVVVLARRPRTAAALVAAAAALKLWPVVLLPALAARRSTRRPFLVAAGAVLLLVAGGVALTGDVERVLSPLRYQSGRGLHVEALLALPAMGAWAVAHAPWTVFFSDFLAVEVVGPGTGLLLAVSAVATVAALALVGLVALRLWRSPGEVEPRAIGWAVLSAATTLVLANKVFSPQYLIWLVPVAIAVVALDRGRSAVRCAVALLAAGLVGQLIYPALYSVVAAPHTANLIGLALLVARMVPIVAVAVVSTRQAWRLSSAVPRPAKAAPTGV